MRFDKLVRDKIPDIVTENKEVPVIHIASDSEYSVKLMEKLHEEVKEFLKNNSTEELADIMEVVYAIAQHKGMSKDSLDSLRNKKAAERGSFSKKIILEETK